MLGRIQRVEQNIVSKAMWSIFCFVLVLISCSDGAIPRFMKSSGSASQSGSNSATNTTPRTSTVSQDSSITSLDGTLHADSLARNPDETISSYWGNRIHILSSVVLPLFHHRPGATDEEQQQGKYAICEEIDEALRTIRSLLASVAHSNRYTLRPSEYSLTVFAFVPFLPGEDPAAQTKAWLSISCIADESMLISFIQELGIQLIPIPMSELRGFNPDDTHDFSQRQISASLRYAPAHWTTDPTSTDLFMWTNSRMIYFVDFWDHIQDHIATPPITVEESEPLVDRLNMLVGSSSIRAPLILAPSNDEIFCHSHFWLMNQAGLKVLQNLFSVEMKFDVHSFQGLSTKSKQRLAGSSHYETVNDFGKLTMSYLTDSTCVRADIYVQPLIGEERRLHFYSTSFDNSVRIEYQPNGVVYSLDSDGLTLPKLPSDEIDGHPCRFQIDYANSQLQSLVRMKTVVFPFTVSMLRSVELIGNFDQWCYEILSTKRLHGLLQERSLTAFAWNDKQ